MWQSSLCDSDDVIFRDALTVGMAGDFEVGGLIWNVHLLVENFNDPLISSECSIISHHWIAVLEQILLFA